MTTDTHFATLDRSIPDDGDYQLALRHAPRIRFDAKEPFLPSVIGYTVFRETSPSPSFPRTIEISGNVATVIEYAVWWDWDIEHLYELEHIWVLLDAENNLIGGEASWHGGFHVMRDENGRLPVEAGRLTVHSEPGKHAFAPSPAWLQERKPTTLFSCGRTSGWMGVHVTPLFAGLIHDRTILNNRLVHTYCQRLAFNPGYEFTKVFDLEQTVFVPWEQLFTWIPSRVTWWAQEMERTIPPHERRGLRIAHRGASAYAQENSAESFRKAFELGSDMIEIDIRITADNVPVIGHDSSLKRLYGLDTQISDLTFAELQAATQSSPIMTFEETATICRELHLGLYLDIKEMNWQAAESILDSLQRHSLMKHNIFGSFRPDHIAEIKAHRPDALTSILFSSIHIDPVALAQSVNADYVHPCWENRAPEPHKLLTPDWMKRVRDAGLGIVCWHEERPSEIEALWNLGVDAICSDMPELLVRSVHPQN
jgi:glycerophosphoryl diester phosphodiesterase